MFFSLSIDLLPSFEIGTKSIRLILSHLEQRANGWPTETSIGPEHFTQFIFITQLF